jgi:hypothetical protein
MYLGDDSALPVWHVVRVCSIQDVTSHIRAAQSVRHRTRNLFASLPAVGSVNLRKVLRRFPALEQSVIAHIANAAMTQFGSNTILPALVMLSKDVEFG